MENKKLSEDQLNEVTGGKAPLDDTSLDTITGGVVKPKVEEQQ